MTYIDTNTEAEHHGFEEEDEEKVRPPYNSDWRKDDLIPRLTVFCQTRASDTDERLDAILDAGRCFRRLLFQMTIVKPSGPVSQGYCEKGKMYGTTYVSSMKSTINRTTMAP